MIKKMWAIVLTDGSLNLKNLYEKKFKNAENEPVWVTNKDPFENGKKQLKIYNDVGDKICVNCEHFADAIEEDIKNFDEGGE